jgi:probable rRNA maturation factor
MAGVNWQFLRHAGSTDVITFDHREPLLAPDPAELRLHGELFVCVDDAVKQAEAFRTTWTSEVVRYLVHGVLHLLGYDDLKPHFRRRMKREEGRLLRWLESRFSLAELSGGVRIKT